MNLFDMIDFVNDLDNNDLNVLLLLILKKAVRISKEHFGKKVEEEEKLLNKLLLMYPYIK